MGEADLSQKKLKRAEKRVGILEDMIENLTRELYVTAEENKNLEEFASTASHDLKAPLNSIKALTDIARQDESVSPQVDGILEMIDQSTSRMARLVDALLEFSRLDTPLNSVEIDGNEVVKEVLIDLRKPIDDSQAIVNAEDLLVFNGDRALFRVLIQNLISNAIKFVGSGVQPKVSLCGKQEGGVYQFSISDNGVGIPPRSRKNAFQILTRLNTTYEGFGIGLATCKKIVNKHGGEIWIEDNPTGGSIFIFTIPLLH